MSTLRPLSALRGRTFKPWIIAVLSVVASGCGAVAGPAASPRPLPSIAPLQAVVASAQVVAGREQRLGFGILDASQVPVPDVSVTVQIFTVPPGGTAPAALGPRQPAPYKGDLLQGKGLYVIHQTFASPGFYSASVHSSKGAVSTDTSAAFQVLGADPTPAVGSPAPSSRNPTAAEVKDITELDTGVPPDDMHYTSIAAAITAHHPFVVYFGSPGFCRSSTCGPEVEVVKSLEPKFRAAGVDFIHIETYKGGRPDNPDINKADTSQADWHLQSDPWVFLVDSKGLVAAKFDGPTAPDEILPALTSLSAKA